MAFLKTIGRAKSGIFLFSLFLENSFSIIENIPYSSKRFESKMPRIETEIKLDFKDVLIRPKRSTLKSRSQVQLQTTYTFRNSKKTWTGVVRI